MYTSTKIRKYKRNTPQKNTVASTRTSEYQDSLINGYNPNTFFARKGFRTIDDMLLDEQVFGILEMKKAFLLGTGYHIKLEQHINDVQSQEILEFVKTNLDHMYTGEFNNDLYAVLSAHEYGFSLSEKLWQLGSFGKYKKKVWLKRLRTVPPHSIEFTTDDYGYLSKIEQAQTRGTIELPIDKMLLYTNSDRFDNPYGKSDMERVYRPYFIKSQILKFWGIYLQKFASPFPVAKVPSNFGDANTEYLLDLLESIQQSMAMVVPESVSIDLQKVTSSGSEYDTAVERMNQSIARGLLVPDLMGFGQTTKGGSHALGEKHFQTFVNLLQFQRTKLQDAINDEILRPLVDYNYGEQETYPIFEFKPYEDENYKEMLKLFIDVVDKGLPITKEDFNHFRKLISFPDLPDEYENINLAPRREYNPNIGGQDSLQDIGKQAAPPKKKDEDQFTMTRRASREPFFYEKRVNFEKEDDDLREFEDKSIEELTKIVLKMRENVKESVKRKEIVPDKDYEAVNKLQLSYLGELKDTLNAYSLELYEESMEKGLSQSESSSDPDSDSEFITNRNFQIVGELKDELLNKVKAAILLGISMGKKEKEILAEIDNVFKIEDHIAKTIRTSFGGYHNLAMFHVSKSEPKITHLAYSAILDKRTTDRCTTLDGFVATKDDPIWEQLLPPNHFFCRSRIRFIYNTDKNIKLSPKPDIEKLESMRGGDGFF